MNKDKYIEQLEKDNIHLLSEIAERDAVKQPDIKKASDIDDVINKLYGIDEAVDMDAVNRACELVRKKVMGEDWQ